MYLANPWRESEDRADDFRAKPALQLDMAALDFANYGDRTLWSKRAFQRDDLREWAQFDAERPGRFDNVRNEGAFGGTYNWRFGPLLAQG